MDDLLEVNVADGFDASEARAGSRPALFVEGRHWSYSELKGRVVRIASAIARMDPNPGNPLVALFAYRSATAYSSVLAALYAGKGYVPLNPGFPVARNLHIADLAGTEMLVVDQRCEGPARELLERVRRNLTVLLPDHAAAPPWARGPSRHRFVSGREIFGPLPRIERPRRGQHGIAYVLFTSGSTGVPKGVTVLHRNVDAFVRTMLERYRPTPEDRFSQNSDLTFDASVHDMFVCWAAGACLYSIPSEIRMAPAQFVRDHALTFWESVPSVIHFMKRMYLLKPGALPSLRWSLFGGEQLSVGAAQLWQAAAPHSTIENTYGPTEATICITGYFWRPGESEAECHHGAVPIGSPYAGQAAMVLDGGRRLEGDGARGELWVRGSQLTPGYWRDAAETQRRYVELAGSDGRPERWYATGDLVLWKAGVGFVHLGRVDRQLKIRGYRVESAEIEHVLREASETDQVAVVGWPKVGEGAVGVVGFVCGSRFSNAEILARCATRLPGYMVPASLQRPAQLPRNANGKIDFRQLEETLTRGG